MLCSSIRYQWVIGLSIRVDRRFVIFSGPFQLHPTAFLGCDAWGEGGGVMGKLGAVLFVVPSGHVVVLMLWRVGACYRALLSDVGVVCELRGCGLHLGRVM